MPANDDQPTAIGDADWPLIQAIVGGEEDALDCLMQRHQHALFYFVLRYLGDVTAARDAVQETFVRVWFKAGLFRPRSMVKTWIYSIALNYCRDAARKLGRAPAIVSLDEVAIEDPTPFEVADPGVSPDAEAADQDRLKQLRYAIDRLPGRLKAAVVLCALEQRSHQDTAEILRTTPKSVEMRLHRAKVKLRAWLNVDDSAHSRNEVLDVLPA